MRAVLAALLAAQLEAALEDISREIDAMSLGLDGLAADAGPCSACGTSPMGRRPAAPAGFCTA